MAPDDSAEMVEEFIARLKRLHIISGTGFDFLDGANFLRRSKFSLENLLGLDDQTLRAVARNVRHRNRVIRQKPAPPVRKPAPSVAVRREVVDPLKHARVEFPVATSFQAKRGQNEIAQPTPGVQPPGETGESNEAKT
jgi:hypothetical protein